MTSREALERLYLGIYSTNEMANYYDIVLQALERKEQLETFITWLRGQTFRKTDEIDKIFKKLKEVLNDE